VVTHLRAYGAVVLLLLLCAAGAEGDVVLESALRTVTAGRQTADTSTFGRFNQSVADSFLLCGPSGCFDSLGSASASQTSELQPSVLAGEGRASSTGEAPPDATSTLEVAFTLGTAHLFNVSGRLTASTSATVRPLMLSHSSISLTGPDTSLDIVVATRGPETLSRDVADSGIMGPGTYRLRVVAIANDFSFATSDASFEFTLALRAAPQLVAAVLPSGRSVEVGTPATAFATVINTGAETVTDCRLSPVTSLPATFSFALADPATNQVIGPPGAPTNILPGASASFVFAFTPTAPFPPQEVELRFDCANTEPAPVYRGVTTLLLSASSSPAPDIVAVPATLTGDGIVSISGPTGTGVFAVAAVNVGAGGSITASVDTGTATLPVALGICRTEAATGRCLQAAGSSVTTAIDAGATPAFGVFIDALGDIPFVPAVNRVFVRFTDGTGTSRGAASVAVRTR
jgi:hypothetical protein